MIEHPCFLRKKFRSLALHFFHYLENNGNINFATNGERRFVENLFSHLEKTTRGRVVLFDIGANVGEYTEMLLEKSAHLQDGADIHVFEPTRTCFDILRQKFAASHGVVLNNSAVSNGNGKAEIFYESSGSKLASLERRNLDAYSIKLDRSETVETIRLEGYLNKKGIGHVHFLKIDIEGHEMAAFEGMGDYFSGDAVDFIQFEYGGANLDSHTSLMELYALFEKVGFVVAKVMRDGLDIRPYKPWMDNFQYANYVAISQRIADKLR